MKLSTLIGKAACIAATALLLTGCGQDYTEGFGEMHGFGDTQQFGNINGYGFQEVGLCSYTGGCMPEESGGGVGANSYKGTDSSGDHAGSHSVDDSTSH